MAKVNYIELNKTLRPINKNTVKSIERNSARFIYVSKDGIAKCERCNDEFTLAKSKHLSNIKCPTCHKTMQIIHSYRRTRNNSIHWEITGAAISDTTFALRYYLVERMNGAIVDSCERARMFINTDKKEICKFEKSIWTDEWKKSGYNFFREFGMSYARNRLFCMDGVVRRSNIIKELNKMPILKYTDIESIWTKDYYAHALVYILPRVSLYEKLQKLGLGSLIKADINTYRTEDAITFNNKSNELTKMLGINKNGLNLLKTHPTLDALKLIQLNTDINEREFMALKDYSTSDIKNLSAMAKTIGTTTYKLAKYLTSQGATYNELRELHTLLTKANYDLKDKSYSMPKDIIKERVRLTLETSTDKFNAKKNLLIKAIYEKLAKTPQLRKFFNGSNGYMVYVPTSEKDFVAEGIAQHNCVGRMGYADKVVKNQTLVFFIREAHNPQASFVTMEYREGRIVQCMLDHNERVKEDTNVYSFCNELAHRLNDCKILSA